MKILKIFPLFALTFFLLNCQKTKLVNSNPSNMQPTEKQVFTLSYADGNANLYKIGQDWLEYVPVTPDQSSSGFYSGGEPKTVKITTEELEKIKELFTKAFADKSQHVENRVKMTGAISQFSDNQWFSVVLDAQSSHKLAIENLLKDLLKK